MIEKTAIIAFLIYFYYYYLIYPNGSIVWNFIAVNYEQKKMYGVLNESPHYFLNIIIFLFEFERFVHGHERLNTL